MPNYRFYVLDADSKIYYGVDADCVDDEAACLAGHEWLMRHATGEVWHGKRFVGQITNPPAAIP